mgnify:CR=1 FL=1
MALNDNKYFLPYQTGWLKDESPVKIWEKSRRIGATYVQSYEDVRDCARGAVPAVWFSSADESAAREYIEYCEQWTKLLHIAAQSLGQVVIDSDRNIKTFVIEFSNGTKIHALSSNPRAFRSKGGKVVLDEFAHHEDQDKMWAAARPCITWGYPLRILSTHNGTSCRYYKFVDAIKKGRLDKWSLHTTDIFKAVEDGLVDKILKRKATKAEKDTWLKDQHDNCFDENTWLQEFCCQAVDEASSFLTYEMIDKCELDNILWNEDQLYRSANDLYGGMDIARKKHLSIIWVLEKLETMKFTRHIRKMENTPFHLQREILFKILSAPRMRRFCIDQTGIGMQLAEETQLKFGKYRVEPVTFTAKTKEEMAYILRTNFEDRSVSIPPEYEIREDLHSVRKVTGISGNIRFDVAATERLDSHADRFWALALALYAAHDLHSGPIYATGRKKRESAGMMEGYW